MAIMLKFRYYFLLLVGIFVSTLLAAPTATRATLPAVPSVGASNTSLMDSNSTYKNAAYFTNWLVLNDTSIICRDELTLGQGNLWARLSAATTSGRKSHACALRLRGFEGRWYNVSLLGF
jgi:hypothetical protein